MRALRSSVAAAAVVAVLSSAAAGSPIVFDDGAGWTAVGSGGGGAWTETPLSENQNSVWASGLPGGLDFTGVAFFGDQTDGVIGLFDDRISESSDLINSGPVSAGDFTAASVYSTVFNFYNESATYQPAELSVYMSDGVTDWYYDLALPVQGWTPYTAIFSYGSGWYDPDAVGGATEFATTLTQVTELGIRILYNNAVTGPQQYGFSNFTLNDAQGVADGSVPEPSTYIMLSTVLMSLGFTFGRKKKQVVA